MSNKRIKLFFSNRKQYFFPEEDAGVSGNVHIGPIVYAYSIGIPNAYTILLDIQHNTRNA